MIARLFRQIGSHSRRFVLSQWFQYVSGTPNKTLLESMKYYLKLIFFPHSYMKFRGLMVRRPKRLTKNIWMPLKSFTSCGNNHCVLWGFFNLSLFFLCFSDSNSIQLPPDEFSAHRINYSIIWIAYWFYSNLLLWLENGKTLMWSHRVHINSHR